jgi:hypothetical protein
VTVPSVVPGVSLSGGLRYGNVSAALQFHGDLAATLALPYGQNERVTLLGGGVLLCGHVKKWFVPCAFGEVSEVQAVGTNAAVTTSMVPHGALGARVAADIPIWRWPIFVEPALDVGGAFGPSVSSASNVVTLPRFNAGLGLALMLELDVP